MQLENLGANQALETIDLRANKISQIDDVPTLAEVGTNSTFAYMTLSSVFMLY